jgi:hypothetical protein
MKMSKWAAVIALCYAGLAQAFDGQFLTDGPPMFNGRMQTCFTHAMLGMDSVINARLGVLPEHVVALTAKTAAVDSKADNNREADFDQPVLTLMLNAYLWQGSAHSYAIQVFYDCAASTAVMAGELPEQASDPESGQSDGLQPIRHN